jgi:hypothetical protein
MFSGTVGQTDGAVRIEVTPEGRSTVVGHSDVALSIHNAPQLTLPGSAQVTAGTLSKLPAFLVQDIDSTFLVVNLNSAQGKVVPGTASAGVFVSQKPDGTLSIAGAVLDVKAALANLSFVAQPGVKQAVIQLSASDGDPLTSAVTTQWSMTVNKAAPTLLAPTALNFKAGLTASLSTVQVADADSSILTMTIDASKGKLSWTDLPSDVAVLTSSNVQISLKGSIASLNSALKGVQYTAPATGSPVLNFTLNDGDTTAVSQAVNVAVLDNAPPLPGGDRTIDVVEDVV